MSQLATYCVSLVFDQYFSSGSFKLSRPVFSDERQNAILCSTAEALFVVLSSLSRRERSVVFNQERMSKALQAFLWSKRNRREKGFPPDFDMSLAGVEVPNVFSTASTLAFFALLHETLDDLADSAAREALGVPAEPPTKTYPYPAEDIGIAVTQNIVAPRQLSPPSPRAQCSMILHGPPGTSKTTIAKRVAEDLRWPLKIITQSDFLRGGRNHIDSEAERVFSLCLNLKNVVILFDELEELILSREPAAANASGGQHNDKESRLLTTSMLPKIHELRDRARVVFIFATNRLTSIDDAATRLGRFDMMYGVDYPKVSELEEQASKTVKESALAAPHLKSTIAAIASALKQKPFEKAANKHGHVTPLLLTRPEASYIIEGIIKKADPSKRDADYSREITDAALKFSEAKNTQAYEAFLKNKEYDRL